MSIAAEQNIESDLMPSVKSRVISVRLPEEQYRKLRSFVAEEGSRNISALARILLCHAIDDTVESRSGTVEEELLRITNALEDLRREVNRLALSVRDQRVRREGEHE